jgi:hypothetical protein
LTRRRTTATSASANETMSKNVVVTAGPSE